MCNYLCGIHFYPLSNRGQLTDRQFFRNFYVHMSHSSRSIIWHHGSTLPYYDCCNFVNICLVYQNCVLFNKIKILNYFCQFVMFEKLEGFCFFVE